MIPPTIGGIINTSLGVAPESCFCLSPFLHGWGYLLLLWQYWLTGSFFMEESQLRMKSKLLVFLLMVSLTACSKQDLVTPVGQQLAAKIQNDLKTNSVTSSVVYIGTKYMTGSASITFDGDIMIIDQNRYNLDRLIEYDIIRGANGTYIEFYF